MAHAKTSAAQTMSSAIEIAQSLADISNKRAPGRGADRQRQLVMAAAQIFRTKGYDATSLQDLAGRYRHTEG